ncbi:MAG TPA: Tm-1-like ATP-binding domain-containing protein [bacterium]|nr:Tm-1-like ATP-binding domain-containing protein [bacterium]
MADEKTILVVGTYDTKSDELGYITACIEEAGGTVLRMDVSVLGEPPVAVELTKHDVAAAAGVTINEVMAAGDENAAMTLMASGASRLALQQLEAGRVDGVIVLGGTMGTDLALDVCRTLPLGVPKYIVSTVAFSPLIAPERLAPDIQMILWAGGLYGLNAICRSSLSMAAGAVLGAARTAKPPQRNRPLIGMTSLGKSCLNYMVPLKPELERRGYEVAVFHTTGMGGRAFESLAAKGAFAAVMDFSLQELANGLHGSMVNSGTDRLENAGRAGIPQIVAPGASDLLDLPTWQPMPEQYAERPYHAHNRLIASVALSPEERRITARAIGDKLAAAHGPAHFLLPLRGIEAWDREGEPAYDPEGLAAFIDEARQAIRPPVALTEVDAHINDAAFAEAALKVLDDWVARGIVRRGVT